MGRIQQACCCAVAALGIGLVGSDARGQFGDGPRDLFEPTPSMHRAPADGESPPLCHCLGEGNSEAVERIKKALRSPLHAAGLEYNEAPLEDVVNVLQEEYKIPIQLDAAALEDIGLGPDEPVTVSVRNISLRSALRLMLRRPKLTYMIQNEVLIITTPDAAEKHLVTCVYDVRDLTSGGRDAASLGRLVDVIITTIATETWAENGGGEAEVRTMPNGVLVISQTQAVHEEIGRLLQALRAVDPAPRPPVPAADGVPIPGEGEVMTRCYMLPPADMRERERFGAQLIGLIHDLVPGQQWEGNLDDGSRVLLMVLPDRLVVRQRESVLQQVEQVLMDIDVVPRPRGRGERRFGPGGIGDGMFSTPPGADNPFGDWNQSGNR